MERGSGRPGAGRVAGRTFISPRAVLQTRAIESLQTKPATGTLSKRGAPPDYAPANPPFARKSDVRSDRVFRSYVAIPIVLGVILELALSLAGQTVLHGISSRVNLWQSWLLPSHRMS